jgi:Protein of unknown function (DUF3716)
MPTQELLSIRASIPVRNQIAFKDGREQPLTKHSLYIPAAEIQLRGVLNSVPCASCQKGAGPFEGGCISFTNEDGQNGEAPYKGSCGNCYWGGQGYRCTLRVGGGECQHECIELG